MSASRLNKILKLGAIIYVSLYTAFFLRITPVKLLTATQACSLTERGRDHGQKCARRSTIVTAYYNLKQNSKHTETEFEAWNARFLRLSDSLIIFTDSESVTHIQELRSSSSHAECTQYILQELNSTFTAKLTNWRVQHELDPEKHVHRSHELYIVWNQKSDWLAQAQMWNPFQSDFFFWCDMGQFRDELFVRTLEANNWFWIERPDFAPEGKLVFLSVEPFSQSEVSQDSKKHFISSLSDRLGAGNFGGRALAIQLWRQRYYSKLLEFIESGKFAGKEQMIMSSLCLDIPSLCYLVESHALQSFGDKWFAMQHVLHGNVEIEEYKPHALRQIKN